MDIDNYIQYIINNTKEDQQAKYLLKQRTAIKMWEKITDELAQQLPQPLRPYLRIKDVIENPPRNTDCVTCFTEWNWEYLLYPHNSGMIVLDLPGCDLIGVAYQKSWGKYKIKRFFHRVSYSMLWLKCATLSEALSKAYHQKNKC